MAQTQCDYDDRVLVRRRYIAEAEAEDKSQVRRALTLFLAADERLGSAFLADRDLGSVAGRASSVFFMEIKP